MKWCRPFRKYSSLPTKSHMMNRRKWSHVEGAFLSLFYWEKFEKGCYLLILYFILELQRVTHVTWWVTPNSPCFLGESQLVTPATVQFFKNIYFFKCSVTGVTHYNSPKNPANWVLHLVLHIVLCVLRIDFVVTCFCLVFALA